ncbi:MAG TPA: MFS transporter [candidate division Zixibacteria bacterium]|nr:MFS transporter [candidate division Zixibacteria bacterium]
MSPGRRSPPSRPFFFYGWVIVAVGFLAHLVCAFHLSSTLSVFLRPLTEDLGVSRGVFSLLRSGEILIGAAVAPFVGPLVDRYGGRWLMAGGALLAGCGFLLLGQVTAFWQFLLVRWLFVTVGGVFMCHMVVTVTISRWFVRMRGRAIAMASLGQGLSKVGIPFVTAALFAWVGWRQTWGIFGVVTVALVVIPAVLFMRRSPEEMGLWPDGAPEPPSTGAAAGAARLPSGADALSAEEAVWSRAQVLRGATFWVICFMFGIANVGIAGLNLHVFAYLLDIGHSAVTAATALSLIASTQLASTLAWGFLSERMEIRRCIMVMFFVQAAGLGGAIATARVEAIYAGFFFYGIGLGGSWVLQELIWAAYYGRRSLGLVRGLGMSVTNGFGAAGAPFFGFLFDVSGSYMLSFVLFAVALVGSALLALVIPPPGTGKAAAHA